MKKRVSLKVFGRVQGVGFRFWVHAKAQSLNLAGWVRNMPDGAVEVLAEGEEEKLGDFTAWVKSGPPFAKIDRVEETWKGATGEFKTFSLEW